MYTLILLLLFATRLNHTLFTVTNAPAAEVVSVTSYQWTVPAGRRTSANKHMNLEPPVNHWQYSLQLIINI